MCGIAGIINIDPKEISVQRLQLMTDRIAHRGPDGEGYWISDDQSTGFGHRRLSIIDLSKAAAQPMHYMKRYTLVFNGEIYNYLELKNKLVQQGYHFTTHSDTEVLLALYDAEKENCLQFLDGMFAFAIHDDKEKKIFCARDRFGEKPFYYSYKKGNNFVFASEIKALKAYAGGYSVNNHMLYNYLAFGTMDNKKDLSETFYEGIFNLPHSHYLTLSTQQIITEVKEYWQIDPGGIDRSITIKHAEEKFNEILYTSVNRRLRSDVNVGSSLSGGLDSSLIVCIIDDLLNRNKAEHSFESSDNRQKTFSARFPGFKRDEGKYMQMVIDKTRVEPHFTFPTGDTLINEIDRVAWHQDEPFGGASILVQYDVMKLAMENNVTVLLDGQGADETMAGYHGYFSIFFRELAAAGNGAFKKEYKAYHSLHQHNPVNKKQKRDIEYYVRKLVPNQVYPVKKSLAWISQKTNPTFNKDFFSTYAHRLFRTPDTFNDLNNSLYHSTMGGDLQVLLRYSDRNSMAFSREVRLPFLSHELVTFLFSLPPNFKIRNGWTKWIMRKSFEHLLPEKICWRVDKIGYEPPQKKWMENNAIKERIIGSRKSLVSNGILDKQILDKKTKGNAPAEAGDKSWEHLMAGYLINNL